MRSLAPPPFRAFRQSSRRAEHPPRAQRAWRAVAAAQAVYYIVTGLWPSLSPETFQAVTGPKTDVWLVQLFGILLCIPGGLLLWALRRPDPPAGVAALSIATAAVLLGGDVIFVARGDIGPVYLLDAAAELVLIAAWTTTLAARAWSRALSQSGAA